MARIKSEEARTKAMVRKDERDRMNALLEDYKLEMGARDEAVANIEYYTEEKEEIERRMEDMRLVLEKHGIDVPEEGYYDE